MLRAIVILIALIAGILSLTDFALIRKRFPVLAVIRVFNVVSCFLIVAIFYKHDIKNLTVYWFTIISIFIAILLEFGSRLQLWGLLIKHFSKKAGK